MRIVIATHDNDRHYYFCNQLIEQTSNVVGVITGAKPVYRSRFEQLKRTFRNNNAAFYARNKVLDLLFRKAGRAYWTEKKVAEQRYFGGSADHFDRHHGDLIVASIDRERRSINNPYYIDKIKELRPDVIAVMGTCLLGQGVISAAPHVLNMHTGLSPYYRGGQTNLWPILEGDFGYFGVTIHVMSLGIDSGEIVFTQRPEVEEKDTYADINCKCIMLGTNKMIDAVKRVESGRLETTKQWTKGKLFNNRDMNNYVAYRYFKKRQQFMSDYCRMVREERLPSVRLIG